VSSEPNRDAAHIRSPLPIGHEQSDQLIRRSQMRFGEMRRTKDVDGFEFFAEITVSRKAAVLWRVVRA
jgi:hypothetical protein